MNTVAIATADIFGCGVLQLGMAFAASRIAADYFAEDNAFYRVRHWELGFYRHIGIRWWKRLLPDGGAWAGNEFRKKTLTGRSPSYFARFILETRRGEATHLAVIFCTPIFFLWNPPWACIAIAFYVLIANLPCVLLQRYIRGRMQRLPR